MFRVFCINTYIYTFIIDKNLCSSRGIDLSLLPVLDRIMESNEYIKNVHKDEKKIIMGPNGGHVGMVIRKIMSTYSASELVLEEMSRTQGISKETLVNILKDLDDELKETRPEINICRFWAKIEEKEEENVIVNNY